MSEGVQRFVGVDYHQGSVQVCVLDGQARVRLNRSLGNDWRQIREAVQSAEPTARVSRVAIEACCGAADLAQELADHAGWDAGAGPPGVREDGAADANGNGAEWYGAAAYVRYAFDPRYTLNARVEAFHDNEGTRLQTGEDLDLFSFTVNVTATPFPSHPTLSRLKVRPEVRYDYADDPEFDGGTEYNQVTAALDLLFTF